MEQQKDTVPDVEFGSELLADTNVRKKVTNDYWQQFLMTGSVADYLNYAASSKKEQIPGEIK